jgi:hypothetical protein
VFEHQQTRVAGVQEIEAKVREPMTLLIEVAKAIERERERRLNEVRRRPRTARRRAPWVP